MIDGQPGENHHRGPVRHVAALGICGYLVRDAFQSDWSENWAVLAGVRTKLQIAHFKFIRQCWLSAKPSKKSEGCSQAALDKPKEMRAFLESMVNDVERDC